MCLEGRGKPAKTSSQDSRSSGRNFNLGPPEFDEVGLFDLVVRWFYDRRSYKRAADCGMGCTSPKPWFNYRPGRRRPILGPTKPPSQFMHKHPSFIASGMKMITNLLPIPLLKKDWSLPPPEDKRFTVGCTASLTFYEGFLHSNFNTKNKWLRPPSTMATKSGQFRWCWSCFGIFYAAQKWAVSSTFGREPAAPSLRSTWEGNRKTVLLFTLTLTMETGSSPETATTQSMAILCKASWQDQF